MWQISPDGALLKTISPNGVVLKEFTQGGCFLCGLHALQSKPPLAMASSLCNVHVAGKPPFVMASWCQVELATSAG